MTKLNISGQTGLLMLMLTMPSQASDIKQIETQYRIKYLYAHYARVINYSLSYSAKPTMSILRHSTG